MSAPNRTATLVPFIVHNYTLDACKGSELISCVTSLAVAQHALLGIFTGILKNPPKARIDQVAVDRQTAAIRALIRPFPARNGHWCTEITCPKARRCAIAISCSDD
jgi:hypothetical protein